MAYHLGQTIPLGSWGSSFLTFYSTELQSADHKRVAVQSIGNLLSNHPSKPTSLSRIRLLWGNNQIGKYWGPTSLPGEDLTYCQDEYNPPVKKTTMKWKAVTTAPNYTQGT